jgi:hypothetical protein
MLLSYTAPPASVVVEAQGASCNRTGWHYFMLMTSPVGKRETRVRAEQLGPGENPNRWRFYITKLNGHGINSEVVTRKC